MSTSTSRLRRHRGDSGFTLIEVIVALSVFAVVAVAALPLVVVGIKTSQKARIETLAKDMSQLRLERMRNLPFQVDRQNGPFVDLLDRYFTNASGTAAPTGEPDCTGQYLAAAPGTGGAPSGSAYRVTCTKLAEATGFSQVVYVQFLKQTGVVVTPPSAYDSQIVARDTAPSRLVGITVLTSWDRLGRKGTLRTYTEVADAKSNRPLITTQAQVVALRVSSNSMTAGRTLTAKAGEVKADGSLTSGSVASVQTVGASVENLGIEQATSSFVSVSAPVNPAGSPDEVPGNEIRAGVPTTTTGTWVDCGWGWFGKSAYGNVSATTAAGVPVVPSNNTTDVTATTGSTTSRSGLLASGNGCKDTASGIHYSFGFRNWLSSPTYTLGLSTAKPLVYVLDPNSGGGLAGGRALGEASVTATDVLSSARSASAMARASVSTVHALPTASHPNGLVTAKLTSSQLVCKSGAPISASYNLTVAWPGGSKTISYPTDASPSLPDPGTISFVEGGVTRQLSEYLSWKVSKGVQESATTGSHSIDHVFGLTAPESVVGPGGLFVELGSLSCAAADNR